MARFCMIWLVAAFFASNAAAVPAPDASPTTPVETFELAPFEPTREEAVLESFVDGVVEAHRRHHQIPGVIVSVVRDGRTLFAKGYGDADIENGVAADGEYSLFRIASVSKTFVWTAVMMLADRGLVDLDADVNQYLKGITIPDAFDAPVTLNELLAHRAGFEESFGLFAYSDSSDLSLTEALLADMPERVFPPGARTAYSNWGTALAQKIVEDVTGAPFKAFLYAEILMPLGMDSVRIEGPARLPGLYKDRIAVGYEIKNGAPVPGKPAEIGPYYAVGGLTTNAVDMATWLRLHLGGGEVDGVRLMSPQTHALMLSRRYNDRDGSADTAHGFFNEYVGGRLSFGHGGSLDHFFANFLFFPELNIGVFVSQNARTDTGLVEDLTGLLITHIAGDDVTLKSAGATAAPPDEYAGVFRSNRRVYSSFLKVAGLLDVLTVRAGDDNHLIVSKPGAQFAFYPVAGAQDVFQNDAGARIKFMRDETGRVAYLATWRGITTYDRVQWHTLPAVFFGAVGLAVFFSIAMFFAALKPLQGRADKGAPAHGLRVYSVAGPVIVALLPVSLIIFATTMLSMKASDFLNYPTFEVALLRAHALFVFIVSFIGLFSLYPAWRGDIWGLWRKIQFTAFVVTALMVTWLLIDWKIVFAPVI